MDREFLRDICDYWRDSFDWKQQLERLSTFQHYRFQAKGSGIQFHDWSDCEGDLYRCFTREELLTNVTLYWMTQTIASSFRLYYEGRRAPLRFDKSDFVQIPCGIAHFPKEIYFPPREWVARGYNVQRWTSMPRGGHFAAAEEPALLAADIRAFFRPLRG